MRDAAVAARSPRARDPGLVPQCGMPHLLPLKRRPGARKRPGNAASAS